MEAAVQSGPLRGWRLTWNTKSHNMAAPYVEVIFQWEVLAVRLAEIVTENHDILHMAVRPF